MKRMMILLLFFSFLFIVEAQNGYTYSLSKEGKIIAIPRPLKLNLNIPSFKYKSYTPQTETSVEHRLKEIEVQTGSLPSVKDRPMNMQVLSAAYRPFFNPYIPMLRRVSPSALDFREIEMVPLSETLHFSIIGEKQTWIGMGNNISLYPALNWQQNNISVSGGPFVSFYSSPFNLSPEYMGGFHTHISYEISNRFGVDTWGQYVQYHGNEKENPHILMSPFYDHTRVGGGVRMKITENFGIGTGLQYEFNPINRKWNRQILLYPIIKSLGR